MKRLLYIVILSLIYSLNCWAYDISPELKTVNRGDIFNYSIKANINALNTGKIKVYFTYNAGLIEFKQVLSGDIMNCQNINILLDKVDNTNTGTLGFECDNIKSGETLLNLKLKALISPDSVALFQCDSLFINDGKILDYTLNIGKISVLGDEIIEIYPEGIKSITPNPIELWEYNQAFVKFNLRDNGTANISIFNVAGTLIATYSNNNLAKGPHILKLSEIITEDLNEFSAGNYVMVLETAYGVYHTNFIYIK